MNYTKELLEKNQVKFVVSTTKEEWEHCLEHSYEHNKDKFTVQGFRKGKAPRHIIEKNYGEYVFFDDAINHAFGHNYAEILGKEPEVEPIASPSVNILDFKDGLKYEITVEVKPEVVLGEYKNIEIKQEKSQVSKEEIDAELELARDKASRLIVVDREVKNGDTATIDFSGSVGGVKFAGGEAKDYDLVIGSHSFIDNFEEQLIGMKKGESKQITVKFPENYMEESLKGKDAQFDVTIKEVREKQLPELDDDFAKNYSEFETLDEYKKDIEKSLLSEKEKQAKYKAENDLIDKITENATVEVSETLIEKQIDEFIKDFEYRLMYQGLKLDDYLKHMNTTMKELRDSRRDDAIQTAKTKLVLEEILKREKIEVSEEELNQKLVEMSEARNINLEDFKKSLSEEFFNRIYGQMVTDKLLDFLTQNNKIA
ncbi:MAG: trigger factor [Christensenellales bacterium]